MKRFFSMLWKVLYETIRHPFTESAIEVETPEESVGQRPKYERASGYTSKAVTLLDCLRRTFGKELDRTTLAITENAFATEEDVWKAFKIVMESKPTWAPNQAGEPGERG